MRKKWLAAIAAALCAILAAGCWLSGDIFDDRPVTAVAQASKELDTPYYLNGIDIVYITPTGNRYHVTDHCGNTQTPYAVTVCEAMRLGYTPCGRCHPGLAVAQSDKGLWDDGETVVYLLVKDPDYHSSPTCKGINDGNGKYKPVAATLREALYLERTPCTVCNPPR